MWIQTTGRKIFKGAIQKSDNIEQGMSNYEVLQCVFVTWWVVFLRNSIYKQFIIFLYCTRFLTMFRRMTLLLFMVILVGCVTNKRYPISQQLDLVPGGICRVAVLPFINKSEYLLGNIVAYRVFMAELSRSTKFRVALEGDIRKAYRQLKITSTTMPDPEQMKIMAERLKVEAIIVGEVVAMGDDIVRGSSLPNLTLHLNFIDAKTGRVFWTIYHHRDGEFYRKILHFGTISNLTRLTQIISHEIIDLWLQRGLQAQCGR